VEIQEGKGQENQEEIAGAYFQLGIIYEHQGQYDKAIEYYENALSIFLEKLGERHPSVATTYNNLALVYGNQGQYDKATEYYENALSNLLEKLGKFKDLKNKEIKIWRHSVGPIQDKKNTPQEFGAI